MKNLQLENLVRGIVQTIIEQLGTLSSTDAAALMNADPTLNPNVAPEDAMTPAEKARMEREAEIERQKTVKQKETELDSKKKELEFQKKKTDQMKRFDIPNLNKDIQSLKGATSVTENDTEGYKLARHKSGDTNFYYLEGRPLGTIVFNPHTQTAAYAPPPIGNSVIGHKSKAFADVQSAENFLTDKLTKAGLPITNIEDVDDIPTKPHKWADFQGKEIK